jgi:hypothetical protein
MSFILNSCRQFLRQRSLGDLTPSADFLLHKKRPAEILPIAKNYDIFIIRLRACSSQQLYTNENRKSFSLMQKRKFCLRAYHSNKDAYKAQSHWQSHPVPVTHHRKENAEHRLQG